LTIESTETPILIE